MSVMNKFTYRMLSYEDYDCFLTEWWNKWRFPVPPRECLPPRGILVSDKKGGLYAGFLYLTDGGIAWMEWVVSDKDVLPARKRGALEYLVEVLGGMARKEGMKLMFTSTGLSGYRNGLVKCGFLKGDENTYQLIKGL